MNLQKNGYFLPSPRLPSRGVTILMLLLALLSGVVNGDEQQAGTVLVAELAAADPHAHHRQMMETKGYQRSLNDYRLPDLSLVDRSGRPVSLLAQLDSDQPVMLNFIFTTCTTICPVLSATFVQVRRELDEEVERVRMISITIDPEHDTPERLRSYTERFEADSRWQFLTGNLKDIVSIQKAFDAYRGGKANHVPLVFLRNSGVSSWVRLEGVASAAEIVREYHNLAAE